MVVELSSGLWCIHLEEAFVQNDSQALRHENDALWREMQEFSERLQSFKALEGKCNATKAERVH